MINIACLVISDRCRAFDEGLSSFKKNQSTAV